MAHWDRSPTPAHKDAYFWVVVRHEIDYLRAAVEGDTDHRADLGRRCAAGRAVRPATWNSPVRTGKSAFARRRSGRLSTRRRAADPRAAGSHSAVPCAQCKQRRHDRTRSSTIIGARPPPTGSASRSISRAWITRAGQVDLREDEQKRREYRALNPQGLVPMLEIDGHRLTQSLAIINYLDLRYPNHAADPGRRRPSARMSSRWRMAIACDIHPLNNLRVLKYLKTELGHSQDEVDAWYAHWISEGLPALEAMAQRRAPGKFLFGDAPTGADVCLVPQLYNARRFNVPLDDYPTLLRAEENANKLEAFAAAHPDRQKVPA